MKIFIVIPAYNEASVIADIIRDVHKYCSPTHPSPPFQGGVRGGVVVYQTVVVDDGSTDKTGEIASSVAKALEDTKQSGAVVLRHLLNRGQGAALRTGINYALKQDADVIVTYDADGQFEPNEIKKLCQPIINGECEIVLGSRFLQQQETQETRPPQSPREQSEREPESFNNGGRVSNSKSPLLVGPKNKIPFLKKLILKSAVLFTRIITGLNLTDTHNGFRALSRKAAQKIKIRQDRMAHASEIIHEIARLKLKYKELPITVKYTKYSRHKGQKLSNSLRILFDLIFK